MTEDEIREIEERAANATPGPWTTVATPETLTVTGSDYDIMSDDDAVFVTASRSDVPALCAEVRRQRAEVAMFRRLCSGLSMEEIKRIRDVLLAGEEVAP